MTWLLRNIGSATLIVFAAAGFLAQLAGGFDGDTGATITRWSLIALAAARGLVAASEALSPYHDSTPGEDVGGEDA